MFWPLYLGLWLCGEQAAKTVINKTNPPTIHFQENLVIGKENDEDSILLSYNASAAVAPDGTMYLLDGGSHKVFIINADGSLRHSFGEKGNGPGSFLGGLSCGLAPDGGTLYIIDSMRARLMMYDKNGKFLSESRLPQGLVAVPQIVGGPKGTIGLSAVALDERFQQSLSLRLYAADLQLKKEIGVQTLPQVDWSNSAAPDFYSDYLAKQFEAYGQGDLVLSACGPFLVEAQANVYEGRIRNWDGDILVTFSTEHRPTPFTEEAKADLCLSITESVRANVPFKNELTNAVHQRAVARAELPQHMHPILGIFPTDEGFGILVRYDNDTQQGFIDFFDVNGVRVKRGIYTGPSGLIALVNNSLYALGHDQDEEMCLRRYHIQNRD